MSARGLGAFLVVLLSVGPVRSPAAADDTAATAHITYVVGNSVYIDAGSNLGVSEGMSLGVWRNGARIASLQVTYLSSRRASCAVVSATSELQVGDEVRFIPSGTPAESTPEAGNAEKKSPRPRYRDRWREAGFRGRLGMRYLTVHDRSGQGETFSQPALDLSLRGTDIGGGPYGLMIDMRAKNTYRTRTAGDELNQGRVRVYRLSGSRGGEDSRFRISAGRLVSSNFSSLSLFDGVLAEYRPSRFSFGVFGGTHPTPDLDFSTEDTEFGFYTRWKDSGVSNVRYTATLGWIRSQEAGSFSREFLFLKGRLTGKGFYAFASQEIDVNRGWKSDVERESLSLTSTYLSLRYRISRSLSVRTGFDNRRRVRLYRDRDTPESEFDDSYRQGFRVGVDGRLGNRLRAGAEYTTNAGSSGDSRSYTGVLGVPRMPLELDLSSRHTRYTGPWAEGWLHSVRLGRPIGDRVDAGVWWGTRTEEQTLALSSRNTLTWLGLDLDVGLGRGWHLFLSVESTTSDVEDNNQFHTSLSYRF